MNRLMLLCVLLLPACADGLDPEAPAVGVTVGAVALPCGENTVASVATRGGTRLDVCIYDDGIESIGESGPAWRAREVTDAGGCALEAYLAATDDDVAVPRALIDSCALRTGTPPLVAREIVDGALIAPPALADGPAPRASYCNASGAVNFQNERCADVKCDPSGDWDCTFFCTTALWGWHDRWLSAYLNQEGNWGEEEVASCGGTTRFRAWVREDIGDAWILKSDVDVLANYWYHLRYYGYLGLEDGDFRFRGDSYSGASHRHTGNFIDF